MNRWMRLWLAMFAALTPAILGAVLYARMLSTGRDRRWLAALLIGILCGIVVLAVSRSRDWSSVGVAIVAAWIGVVLACVFDAQWNSVAQVARQLQQEYGLGETEARQQARTILGGSSLWALIRGRLDWVGWLTPVFAALGAMTVVKSRLFGVLLRIPNVPDGGG